MHVARRVDYQTISKRSRQPSAITCCILDLCLCVHTYVGMCLQRQHGVFVYQCVTPPAAWELGQDGGEKDIEFEKLISYLKFSGLNFA